MSQGGLQFYLSEIGRQLVKAPLAASVSPYLISPTHPTHAWNVQWNVQSLPLSLSLSSKTGNQVKLAHFISFAIRKILKIYRGYYTVARRYEFYVRVARTISHEWAQRTSEILFWPREHKIHIFSPPCNVLFIIWRNQFNKSKRRQSWRHWTIRHSQRWHTENTPLGSRMKWRMESTSGLVPSKTLSSI